ncbi:MAG TPA: MFS transporter [Anaerolineae bacterium]|nr:MFS transporter [Anaerolineae bacterium]
MKSSYETVASVSNQKTNRRALGVIFFIMLMDIIGLGILAPVAPYIVARYSHDALMVTLLTTIYAAAQFTAAPMLGKISDRIGRRPVLLVCVFGSAIGYFIFGIGGALWVLFLARLIDGITGGNISTAAAYIVDVSRPEERAKNFTLMGMAFGLGFILGPALGGALGQLSVDAPMFAAGVISLVSVGVIYFLLPESLPKERRETAPLRLSDFNPFASIGYMLRKPGLGVLLVVYALFNFAFNGANSTAGVFLVDKFAAQPWQIGLLFVMVGIATAVVQAALIGRLVPMYGEKRMAMVSLIGNAVGGLLIFAAPALWLVYPISLVQAAITGFIWSTMGTLTANRVSEREQGLLAGVNTAVAGLMAALGPLWAGAMYDTVMPGAPYWMGAIILGVACLVLARVKVSVRASQPVSVQVAES